MTFQPTPNSAVIWVLVDGLCMLSWRQPQLKAVSVSSVHVNVQRISLTLAQKLPWRVQINRSNSLWPAVSLSRPVRWTVRVWLNTSTIIVTKILWISDSIIVLLSGNCRAWYLVLSDHFLTASLKKRVHSHVTWVRCVRPWAPFSPLRMFAARFLMVMVFTSKVPPMNHQHLLLSIFAQCQM